MSISSQISRISRNVTNSLSAVAAKGVTVPSGSTSDDLPTLIASISSGTISAYAYIVVSYMEGATVSCTNSAGTIDLSSTMKLFLVANNAASCTVTSVIGTQTATRTVAVSAGESYYVWLTYDTYLYHLGDLCSASSGGWEGKATPYAQNGSSMAPNIVTYNSDNVLIKCTRTSGSNYGAMFRAKTPIDLTGYNKL